MSDLATIPGISIPPPPPTKINVISLGAGVQSSTLCMMAAVGEVGPMPDFAVFADTQAEPPSVYRWLDWLESAVPFPVIRATAGSLEDAAMRTGTSAKTGNRWVKGLIPAFMSNQDGTQGIMRRGCTSQFKVDVVFRAVSKASGVKRTAKVAAVTQWIGISKDEADRMKPAREAWIQNRWPLIERRMTRRDCIKWMTRRGFPEPPRSACSFCPYHNDREWARLKRDEPGEFQRAVDFEQRFQAAHVGATRAVPWLHRSMVPLDKVKFDEADTLPLFRSECEGMCGV